MERFAEDCDIENEINLFIDDVMISMEESIDDNYLNSIETDVAADRVMEKLNKIVAWGVLPYDGEVTVDEAPLELYTPDPEPKAPPIDPWARGIVTTRKKVASQNIPKKQSDMDEFSTKSPSVSSRMTGSTRMSRTSRATSAYTSTSAHGKGDEEEVPEIFDIDEDGDAFGFLNKTGDMFNKYMKQRSRQNQAVVEVDEEDEFNTLREEVDRIAKESKGKKVAFDAQGHPIYINSVKPDNLPPLAVPLGLNITDKNENNDVNINDDTGGKGRNKKTKKIRVAGAPGVDSTYFTATTNLATSLAGNEPALQPGVNMRVGDNVIRGPDVPEDPGKMSRKNFFSRGTASSTTFGEPSTATGKGALDFRAGSPSSDFEEDDEDLLPLSMIQDKYRDIDPLEGGRPQSKVETSGIVNSANEAVASGQSSQIDPVTLPSKPNPRQAYNIALMTGGPENPGLRDRATPSAQISPSKMRKGPAPPVGQVSRFDESQSQVLESPTAGASRAFGMSKGGTGTRSGNGFNNSRSVVSGTASRTSQGKVKQERKDISKALF